MPEGLLAKQCYYSEGGLVPVATSCLREFVPRDEAAQAPATLFHLVPRLRLWLEESEGHSDAEAVEGLDELPGAIEAVGQEVPRA